ncbi:MAG: 50S ribosomal protein L23, partial [Candidatus Pacearchaeota archaeon]|nr:50S ribosomal protein L23 [Candidatus Pacearchaeota archaeon]
VKEERKQAVVRFSSLGVLERPHVTEKAGSLAERGVYVFKVSPRAAKGQVKEAVEKTYGVKVVGVRMIKIPGKSIRLGKTKGVKKGYRKALVQLAKGQEIEIMPR